MKRVLKWLGIAVAGFALLLGLLLILAINGVIGPPTASPEAIASSVQHDPVTLDRAHALPAASSYGSDLQWQSNGSTCGPASLVNAFRSLGDDAPDEGAVLDPSGLCPIGMCFGGLTLDELALVAETYGKREVQVLRDISEDEFLEQLKLSNDPRRRVIVNFTRKPIFGTGGGHHSPIGGYLEDEDLVLVLDVNEAYQPWLIERERLFAAMDTQDGGKKRGLLIIE
jgi:hypothetical protein